MNKTILIVDDSLTVRADLEDAFEENRLAAISCATAAEARALLASPDIGPAIGLIVLDVLLPDADGVDLLREIRANPLHATLPVLMLSSESDVKDRIRGLITGSNDYVGKPYDRDYVIARTRELLGQGASGVGVDIRPADAKINVLLIDDSTTFRERFGDMLREQGFHVRTAESGEEGLRSAAVHRPAAVVVDGVLPGMDGPTVIRKLRLDAALRDTICVLLTGADDFGAELRALDSGADAFVNKGDDLDMVLARVTAALRNIGNTGNTASERETASLHSPKRILAVDDSLTYLHELNDTLSGEGYDVILAHSGEEALEMLTYQRVDCILLDRLMPGMDGTEACRRLKASPATRDIPLIMLTAMEDREAMIEGLSTGADDYVLKSNELDVLKARVRAQLRRKQFEDESRRIRTELMNKELEAAEARATRELAESRAELLDILEQKNRDLQDANRQLIDRQDEIAEKNLQLEEASRMKSEFLSNMSHELRTPLNAIIGFSEILKDGIFGELTPRQTEYIGHVFAGGRHLLALINDILDLSKVEAGKMTLDLEEIDVNTMLLGALDIVRERAVKSGTALDFAACADPPAGGMILADGRKLKQIVYNLLSNAVKFSGAGGSVQMQARTVARADTVLAAPPGMAERLLPLPPSDYDYFLEIRVIDSGIGIAEADLPHLFQSFRQLGSSLTRQYEGTGLGLALVQRLVELHQGRVGVASAPGRGAHFVVWLPWRAADALAAERDDAGALSGTHKIRRPGRQALVIDDDPRASVLLRIHLESIGFDVEVAPNAAAAMQHAAQFPPDLITLDIELPDANGWDVLHNLKSDAALKHVPVVIVSIIADEQQGVALGAAKTIPKPLVRKTLIDAIHALGLGDKASAVSTVLVVDNDPHTGSLVTLDLGGPQCKVLHAHDGRSAIDAIRQVRPDLMILDLDLPDISGFEVVEAMNQSLDAANIPIVVLTAHTISQADKERLSGRVLRIMQKRDFSRQHFIGEVKRALQSGSAG